MARSKSPRTKGKISMTRFFQNFSPGDYVAVDVEPSIVFGYSSRVQGRTGKVVEKVGSAYKVQINDLNKPKIYLIKPIHLKKITVK